MRSATLAVLLIVASPGFGQVPTPSPLGNPPGKPQYPGEIYGKDLTTWLRELKESTDPAVRESAVKVLPGFGPDARGPSLEPLLLALRSEPDPGIRVAIIDMLGVIGFTTQEEGKKITSALALEMVRLGPGSILRLHIVRSLTNFGPTAAASLPNLLDIVKDPSWETRRAVAFALGRIGYPTVPERGPSERALGSLSGTLLKDSCSVVRLEAVQSLVLLGPPEYNRQLPQEYPVKIKPFLDAATAAQKTEKDKSVQIWLMMLIMRYDGSQLKDENIKLIVNHIDGADVAARLHALSAVGMLGEKAKPFIGKVTGVLTTNDPPSIGAALSTLAALGDVARPALPELEKLKTDTKNEELKALVTQTISAILKQPPPAAKKM